MNEYVNYRNQMVQTQIDLNNQIKQAKKDNELLIKQKEDRIEQLEKELKDFKGQFISVFFQIDLILIVSNKIKQTEDSFDRIEI